MNRLRPRITYANVVATLALVLALGGASALAAGGLATNSVGTRQLRKNAVTGAKVKNGSLTGADISGNVRSALRAATAGSATVAEKADHAATAQVADSATAAGRAELAKLAEGALHASDADTLRGLAPSAFQAAGSVQRVDFDVSGCGAGAAACTAKVLESDGFTLEASCINSATGELNLVATTAPAGTVAWRSGLTGTGPFSDSLNVSGPTQIFGMTGPAEIFQGAIVLRAPSRTLALQLVLTQDNAGACRALGTALSA